MSKSDELNHYEGITNWRQYYRRLWFFYKNTNNVHEYVRGGYNNSRL